ncbi:IS110 family transposase [Anaerocellum danielii]|uniref:IS110 family transposase n=1 Tax=Anaerocellum danielii TaxID=1387557 RepID=A0ABZ0U2T8_9FIRM|nr:IS110 family transposase [Caldicellulosiruptor danielii]WPX08030.1 IS110 family transposase [Caldicellulosiruptor danielii]
MNSIPGIDKTAAAAIIVEIGIDMSKFKTAEHICSWAGLSPGNNESAGKKSPLEKQRVIPTSRGYCVKLHGV